MSNPKMQRFKSKLVTFTLLVLLPPIVVCSQHEEMNQSSSYKSTKHNSLKLSHKMTLDIRIHGVLLWASMGFLMPVGILIIRMISREDHGSLRVRILLYIHAIFQILSVVLATAGAVLSIENFDNSFNNNHQRIGLALYGVIWVQAGIGFYRPKRGSKGRSTWYFVHWLLGTTISLMGIINIYTGLKAYHDKTSRSIHLWTILFTAQVIFMAFMYLFQDKWEYIQKKGVILGNEPAVTPSPAQVIPQSNNDVIPKQLLREPCQKSNALVNYFV